MKLAQEAAISWSQSRGSNLEWHAQPRIGCVRSGLAISCVACYLFPAFVAA